MTSKHYPPVERDGEPHRRRRDRMITVFARKRSTPRPKSCREGPGLDIGGRSARGLARALCETSFEQIWNSQLRHGNWARGRCTTGSGARLSAMLRLRVSCVLVPAGARSVHGAGRGSLRPGVTPRGWGPYQWCRQTAGRSRRGGSAASIRMPLRDVERAAGSANARARRHLR